MGYASSYQIKFKEAVRTVLGDQLLQVFTFWKGRVALYAILKALNIRPGDEVIMPAFTCVVVPNPVLYLGGMPVYVDIDPRTYNMNIGLIESRITKKTKFIMAQNTFGLSSDFDAITAIAQQYGITVIEDCAHGFGGTYKGKPNGTVAEAAFFSTQWNKPFSTGLGGIAVTRNMDVASKLKEFEDSFIPPSLFEESLLRTLYITRTYLLTSRTYWLALKLYRWLSRYNLILGSSKGEELQAPVQPKYFAKGFSDFQARAGIKQLMKFSKTLEHRRKTAACYDSFLKTQGIDPLFVPSYAEHAYLKYPLLVKSRDSIFKKAIDAKIELGDWFLSPIHPIKNNFEHWNYRWGTNPIGEKISQHIINLPTHPDVDDRYMDRIQTFLQKNRDHICSSVEECLKFN